MRRRGPATANFLFRTLAATAPLLLGTCLGHEAAGTAGFLGSYLLLCSFPDLDSRPVPAHLAIGGGGLIIAAGLGSALAASGWYVIGLVGLVVCQAVTHLAHRDLQLAAAMSCLAYLLAPMALDSVPEAICSASYLFALGVLCYGVILLIPLSPVAGGDRFPMMRPLTAVRRQEWFVFSLCLTAMIVLAAARGLEQVISDLLVSVDTLEFVLWAVASSLRIPVSDPAALRRRGRQRSVGTVLGSAVVLGLVLSGISEFGVLVSIAVVLMVMQVIGAGKYLWWSTGLTVIAVLVTLDHGTSLELDALSRVLATGFGAAWAVGLDVIYRRLRADRKHRRASAGRS